MSVRTRSTIGTVAAALAATTGLSTALAGGGGSTNYTYKTIAKVGDAAPGAAGTFTGFAFPQMNARGQVSFTAATTSGVSATGMWYTETGAPSSLTFLVGEGTQVPGAPQNTVFDQFGFSFYHPVLNDNGTIGFAAPVVGGSTSAFRMKDGILESVLLAGDAAPGLGNGVNVSHVGNLPSLSQGDLMAIYVDLEGDGVDATNDRAIYMHWFGGVSLLAREGSPVPGMPGTTFGGNLGSPTPQIADNGRVTFRCALEGATQAPWAIMSGWPAALDLLVKTGDMAPSGLPFENGFGGFWGLNAGLSATVFPSLVDDNGQMRSGFYRHDGNNVEQLVLRDANGPLGTVEHFDTYGGVCNADGTTAIRINFDGNGLTDDDDSAIVKYEPGMQPQILAQEGSAAHVFGGGAVYDELEALLGGNTIDDTGRVYASVKVQGNGIDESNDWGLVAFDGNGAQYLVIRQGQWITLNDGITRQVEAFEFSHGTGMHAGRAPGVNDHGDVAMRVTFTDDTVAILVAQRQQFCLGDVNHDGIVNFADVLIILSNWEEQGPVGENGDTNLDGVINFADVLIVLTNWNNICF